MLAGIRIPMELLLRELGEGATIHDLLDACPWLTVQDVRACLVCAADAIAGEESVTAEPV